MNRMLLSLRAILPAVWLGMLIGIAFLEAPLKFQAPGITIPLGLGIGRLVFAALEISSVVIIVALLGLALMRPRPSVPNLVTLGIAAVVMAVQGLLIRPALNARSDAVIAGTGESGSFLHYAYIVTDVLLLAVAVALIAQAFRSIFRSADAIKATEQRAR